MNCAKCGYLLFGLSQCRCPECGTPFATTDYAFPRGSIQFLCPRCGQSYLGIDHFGLPSPRQFACVKCGAPISASEMPVRPLRDGVVGEALRYGTPWEHRDRVGAVRAFGQTMVQIASQPRDFFRMLYGHDRWSALSFGLLAALLTAVFLLVLGRLVGAFLFGPAALRGLGLSLGLRLVFVVPVAAMLWIYGYALGIYLCLRLFGRANADFEGCIQAVAYANAVLPAMVLPPVGLAWYVWLVWVGIRESEELTGARTVVAVALPLLVLANGVLFALL